MALGNAGIKTDRTELRLRFVCGALLGCALGLGVTRRDFVREGNDDGHGLRRAGRRAHSSPAWRPVLGLALVAWLVALEPHRDGKAVG